MSASKRIIVGYDPEHGGPDVLKLGRMLAEIVEAKRVVVAALPWPSYLAGREDLEAMAAKEMHDEFTRLREADGDPELETRAVPSGSAALALHVAAEDADAAMIVLGSCHRGPIGRTLLGSVGESLMHDAPCSIAIAPIGYAERPDPDLLRVAVAFDGSDESRTALDTAIGLTRRTKGQLTLLSVADYPNYGYATAYAALSGAEIVDSDRRYKAALLEETLEAVPFDVRSSKRLLTGIAGPALSDVSGEFDLLVAGSRAYGSMRRTLLGSTTRKLIRSSECPVLVVPRGAGGDPLGLRADYASDAPPSMPAA